MFADVGLNGAPGLWIGQGHMPVRSVPRTLLTHTTVGLAAFLVLQIIVRLARMAHTSPSPNPSLCQYQQISIHRFRAVWIIIARLSPFFKRLSPKKHAKNEKTSACGRRPGIRHEKYREDRPLQGRYGAFSSLRAAMEVTEGKREFARILASILSIDWIHSRTRENRKRARREIQ